MGFPHQAVCGYLLLSALGVLYLSRPFYDPDFYWHLKTGQWLWQHKSLPVDDPFGVAPLPSPTPRSEFILTSYWLFQTILYAFSAAGGMAGIILFRAFQALIALEIFRRWADLRNGYVVSVLTAGTVLILDYYFLERPQFFSFICYAILVCTIFGFLDQRRKWRLIELLIPLSLLMIVWANSHGGFILGQGFLVFISLLEGVKFFHPSLSPLPTKEYRILLVSSAAALLSSFINPNPLNSLDMFASAATNSMLTPMMIQEYLSLPEYLKTQQDWTAAYYLTAMLVTASALLTSRHRSNLTWVGMLALTGYMGFQHIRYTPFFLVTATMFMMRYFEEYRGKAARILLLASLAGLTTHALCNELPNFRKITAEGPVPQSVFPVKAADFLASSARTAENVFTVDYWGGYIIWRIGPGIKVFEDGRGLNMMRTWEYKNSYWDNWEFYETNRHLRPYWKGLFKQYGISIAILPLHNDIGKPNDMARSISQDTNWEVAFSDGFAVVFRRKQ